MLYKGDRIKTSLGVGTVNYVRMAAPNYSKIESVSIILDSKKDKPNYSGTIFSASEVEKMCKW